MPGQLKRIVLEHNSKQRGRVQDRESIGQTELYSYHAIF